MKVRHMLAVLILCLLTLGCVVVSIYPLYTEKDIIFKPALLGTWSNEDSTNTYKFSSEDSLSYTLICTEDSVPASFEAHLTLLGNQLFLDVLPTGPEFENETYKWFLIRSHMFVKVTLKDDLLYLDGIDTDWLTEKLEKGEIHIAHERPEQDRIIFTAKTEDLQSFVLKFADDKEAFPEGDKLHRNK